jgi:hypothetical protein
MLLKRRGEWGGDISNWLVVFLLSVNMMLGHDSDLVDPSWCAVFEQAYSTMCIPGVLSIVDYSCTTMFIFRVIFMHLMRHLW